jgi:hypothetical protein
MGGPLPPIFAPWILSLWETCFFSTGVWISFSETGVLDSAMVARAEWRRAAGNADQGADMACQ